MEAETGTKLFTRPLKPTTHSNQSSTNGLQTQVLLTLNAGTPSRCTSQIWQFACMMSLWTYSFINLPTILSSNRAYTSMKKSNSSSMTWQCSLKYSTTFDWTCNWRSSSWWTASRPIIGNEWFKLVSWRRSDQKTILWGHNTENGQLTQGHINKRQNLGSMRIRLCNLSCWL